MKIQSSITDCQSDLSGRRMPLRAQSPKDAAKRLLYKTIPEHLCCELNGETVILSLANGRYYGINAVGSRIWELLENYTALPEIEQTILGEYEVTEEVCRQEIAAFLALMLAEKLIETRYESSVTARF